MEVGLNEWRSNLNDSSRGTLELDAEGDGPVTNEGLGRAIAVVEKKKEDVGRKKSVCRLTFNRGKEYEWITTRSVHWDRADGDESETGRDGKDGGTLLLEEVREKERRQMNDANDCR